MIRPALLLGTKSSSVSIEAGVCFTSDTCGIKGPDDVMYGCRFTDLDPIYTSSQSSLNIQMQRNKCHLNGTYNV